MRRGKNCILVVDSNPKSCNKIYTMISKNNNYETSFAFSVEDGIEKIEKSKTDIILIDNEVMNIETICKALNKKTDIHIAFIGACKAKKHSYKFFEDRVHFIAKPVNKNFINKLELIVESMQVKRKLKQAEGTLRCAKKIIDEKENQLIMYSERMDQISTFIQALNTNRLDTILDAFDERLTQVATIDYFSLFACNEKRITKPEMLLHNQTRLNKKPFIDPTDEQNIMSEAIIRKDKVILTPFTHSSIYENLRKKLHSNYIASFPIVFNKQLVGVLNFTGKLIIFGADFASISIICEALACPLHNAMQHRDMHDKHAGEIASRIQ